MKALLAILLLALLASCRVEPVFDPCAIHSFKCADDSTYFITYIDSTTAKVLPCKCERCGWELK